ncbi:TPA: acyltransferase family protein [Providencia alcalifaciens]|uniref:acyltransferase family protein n=1 Tax=Providencia alcalifaciens TaxID=126385 RepID=UPI0012B59E9E|nr:acyltransferase [Providencia alcalifaciens]MTC37608.1 acyltransferase family protein [Providencia alcalifaciens]
MDYSYLLAPLIFLFFFLTATTLSKLNFLPHLNENKQRYDYLDGLRGIAAILVVCAHSWRFRDIVFTNELVTKASYSYMEKMGAVGVQLFFCITGFLFFEKIFKYGLNQDWRHFYLSRIKRLAPLFFVFCFLVILIGIYQEGVSLLDKKSITSAVKLMSFGFLGTKFDIGEYNSGYMTPILWTLPYEWRFYIAVPFLAAMCSNRSSMISLVFTVIFIYSAISLTDSFNVWAFFFSGGAVAFLLKNKKTTENVFFSIMFYITLVVIVISLFRWSFDNYGVMRLITTSCLFFFAMYAKPLPLRSRGAVYLGEISYGIYLFHILVIYVYSSALKEWVINIESSAFMCFSTVLIYVILTCVFCSLTFKYIEHPFMKIKITNSLKPQC